MVSEQRRADMEPEPLHIKDEQEDVCLADGEDGGGSESGRKLQPHTSHFAGAESDGSDKSRKGPKGRFSCSMCRETFTRQGKVNVHMRSHAGEKPVVCSVCGKSFTQREDLNYHLKIHTGEKPFSCSVCGKTFRHKGPLQKHMFTHTATKPLSCSDCSKEFRWSSQIRVHRCVGESPRQPRRNQLRKPLSCSQCAETFPNYSRLMTHMRIHTGKKLLSCTVCGAQRQYSSQMKVHMRRHTGERPYSCTICGKTFSQSGIMMQHMAVHSGVKPFSCSDCGRRFFWHFQIKKHKCPGKSQQNRGDSGEPEPEPGPEPAWNLLSPQRRLKPDPNKTTNPCVDGDESADIAFWKDVRQHQSGFTYQRIKKVSHTDECSSENRLCSEDNIKTEPRDADADAELGPHSSESHMKCPSGEKSRSHCSRGREEALRRFTAESELTSHHCVDAFSQLHHSHTDQRKKLWSCSQCGEGFDHNQHLQLHMRSHTGDEGGKPLRCSVCKSSFSDRELLLQHMRIHTTQTQFSCLVCGKEFAWRRYLTKHMDVHTKEKIRSCGVCDEGQHCVHDLSKLQPPASSSTEHMETEADDEDCGRPEPAGNSDPNEHLQPGTEDNTFKLPEADSDVCDFWKERREPQSGSNCVKEEESDKSLNLQRDHSVDSDVWKEARKPLSCLNCVTHDEESQSHTTCDPDRKQFSCSQRERLRQHMFHTQLEREEKQENLEPPHIKEEQEEADFTPVPVKSEEEEEEEEAQSSQLHQRHTEEVTEDCGGPEPARNPGPREHLGPDTEDKTEDSSEPDTDDSDFWKDGKKHRLGFNSFSNNETAESDLGRGFNRNCFSHSDVRASEPQSDDSVDSDFWKESRKPQPDPNSLKSNDASESDTRSKSLRKPHSCSECGKKFLYICHMKSHMRWHTVERPLFCSVCGQKCLYKSHLKIHMRTHTGEKPFICPVCGKKYAHKASMQTHMMVHTVEKQYSCHVCDESFAWFTELKYHECVGESSHENQHQRGTT